MARTDPVWLDHPGAPVLRAQASPDPDRRRLELEVAADSPWVEGHFPDRPVLPGVVLLRWAIEAGGWLWPELATVRSISNLKFQHPILPPAQLALTLDIAQGDDGHRLKFRYEQGDRTCAQGGVTFA
jgi:3-hydroxymyristoyl/3-hydroxydecanoyl-(acyl carrier protein) dehydratase